MTNARRKHSRSLDGQTEFILSILIGGTIWAHRNLVPTVEKFISWTLVVIVLVSIIILVLKIRRKYTHKNSKKYSSISIIDNMSGIEFEKYVAMLLGELGYTNVRLTEKYDLGIDIIASKDGITWGIQVKRYSGLVKADAVRQVVTALNHYGCERAMVVTNSYYSKTAIQLAKTNNCVLISRSSLEEKALF